ncbi:CAF1-domain-containing protein [Nemania serpens]|nr:CAF1-domain-containing protein [Nemania serpens]
MAMNYSNFWSMLPSLMGALADSRWVAIDVEMTGISTTGRPIPSNSTPQEAYRLVKAAAEMYQILQIGFTFCKFNNTTSGYETKTIECPVSPLFPPGIGAKILTQTLNRKFTTSATSYAFLQEYSFPFDSAINSGVPYLSREEELEVKRQGIHMFGDDLVNITKLTGQIQDFYRHYRRTIQCAVEKRMRVQIQGLNGQSLTGLEINIIHQLLQQEFPFLVAMMAPGGHMIVVWANPGQPTRLQQRNTEEVNKYIGIRNVIDALAGGDFAQNIKLSWLPAYVYNWGMAQVHGSNRPGFTDASNMRQVEAILKSQSPIIVGHNLIHDLAFIYQTFFGQLPDTLDEFLSAIHKLFPRIIDTKYMFMKSQPRGDPSVSLKDLHKLCSRNQFPIIQSTDNFLESNTNCHHAGYDSALTMILFLKQTLHIKDTWSKSRPVTETLHRPRDSGNQDPAAASNPSQETILDKQDEWAKASRCGLDRYSPLQPEQDQAAAAAAAITVAEDSVLGQGTPPHNYQASPRQETYSVYETHMIPPWEDPFWRDFGNRARISNSCVVEFK